MSPLFLRRLAVFLPVLMAACASSPKAPPVPEPAPPVPETVPQDPRLEAMRLELQAARLLLAEGRAGAAVEVADDLRGRIRMGGLAPGPDAEQLEEQLGAFWTLAQVLASLEVEPAERPPGDARPPEVEPWWDPEDLARPEVQVWRDHFLGEGAVSLGRLLQRSTPYRADILRGLREEGVPSQLWVLVLLESGFDVHAASPSQAVGLWQLVPNTAHYLGLLITPDRDQRRDWVRSTRAAGHYLREMLEELGDGILAVAAFNCGPGRVRREIRAGETRDFWRLGVPPETRRYVPRALALVSLVGEAGPAGATGEEPLTYDSVPLPHPVSIAALAGICEIPEEEMLLLNPAWLREVTPADGHAVHARVPREAGQTVLAALRDGGLPEASPRSLPREHRVESGDTLWDLARRYGTTVRALREANDLTARSVLRPGQVLRVPGEE